MPEVPEKLKKVLKGLEKRLRLIVFIILAALMGLVYQINKQDTAKANNTAAPPRAGKMKQVPSPDPPSMVAIESYLATRQQPIHQSAVNILLSDNMFNAKRIVDTQQREVKANNLYANAENLYNQKKYADAYQKIEEALKLKPGHIKAQQLKARLERILGINEN